MNQEEIQQLDDRLQAIRKRGITILLVEHVMELVMGVTDRIAVLNFGQKIAEGTPTEIQADRSVQEAYLGQRADCPVPETLPEHASSQRHSAGLRCDRSAARGRS